MKIIQYLPYSYHIHTGGLEKIAQTLSDGLNNEDITVINIASNIKRWSDKELSSYTDTLLIPSFDLVYNFPVPKFWTKGFWQQFAAIKKYNPDIIITHTRFFVQSMIGGLIAKWLWCKRVHIEHGSWFVTGYPRYIKLWARLFDWTIGLWIFRQCDQIITISQMHRQFISKFTHKTPVVIYNPIDYQPQEKVRNNIIHIGFLASLLPRKWCDFLIQALKQLKDKERICTIVWDGSEKKMLENLVKESKLTDRIYFIWADDRSNRLHKFDIFVNPSHQEGLPTTVVEALIAKCIVVATDVGGTKEISEKYDLIVIKPGSTSDLQQWIELAMTRLHRSGESFETVVNRFGPKKVLGQYDEVFRRTIDQK